MNYSSSTDNLPQTAQELYDWAYDAAFREYGNRSFANQRAWTEVGRAGFRRNSETEKWEQKV